MLHGLCCWGGSRSTKPCVYPCKVAAAGDERYLVCAAVAAAVVSCANCSSYVFCNERLFLCVVLCVSWSCGGRSHWNGCMMLHGLCVGEEAGARNLVFFRVKWLQPAMKGTSSVRRLRLRSFHARIVPPVLQRVVASVCVVLCVSWNCGGRSHWNGCMMLHRRCVGEEVGAWNLVFFRVKWLQPAMKGTSSVRRLRLRSFHARIVPPMCFATSGCVSVRSSMRFLNLWLQFALEWLLHCRHLMLPRA